MEVVVIVTAEEVRLWMDLVLCLNGLEMEGSLLEKGYTRRGWLFGL